MALGAGDAVLVGGLVAFVLALFFPPLALVALGAMAWALSVLFLAVLMVGGWGLVRRARHAEDRRRSLALLGLTAATGFAAVFILPFLLLPSNVFPAMVLAAVLVAATEHRRLRQAPPLPPPPAPPALPPGEAGAERLS